MTLPRIYFFRLPRLLTGTFFQNSLYWSGKLRHLRFGRTVLVLDYRTNVAGDLAGR